MNKTKHNFKRQTPTWLRVLCLTFLATWMGFQSQAQIPTTTYDFNANSTGWTGNITRTTATTACGSASMRRNLYSSVTTGNMVSPNIGTTSGGVITLTYKYKVANWSANTVGTPNPWGSFNVQYGATAAGPWTTVQTIDASNHTVSGTCTTATATFTPPAGALFIKWDAFWSAGDYYLNFDDVTVSEAAAFPCSGTPAPGNTLPATSSICNGQGATLSLQNATPGSGVSFQWLSSPTSGSGFAPVSGATSQTYSPTNILATTYYKCEVTCAGNTGTSNEAAVNIVNCTYDVAVNQTGGSFNDIMPSAGGSGNTVTLQGTGTSGDDRVTTTIPLTGTTFQFQGAPVTGFQMCTNGWITFNTANTSAAYINNLGTATPNKLLAIFYDDLALTGGTTASLNNCMRYFVDGTLGSGTATIYIQWSGMEKLGNPGPNMNFQIVLFEAGNKIQYQYGNFQAFDGTLVSNYSYSIGYNGTNPAGTTAADRFAMSTAFTNHFTTTDPTNLAVFPPCNSYIEMTPGVHSGPGTAPAIVAPSNDAQGSPLSLATNSFPCTDYCGTYYTSLGATNSAFGAAACGLAGAEDDDVWFSFTTSAATDYTIKLRSYLGYNGVIELIDGSNTVLYCANATGSGGIETINATGLTAGGTTYYLRVFDNVVGTPGGKGQFSICVNEVITAPANDDICGAVSLTVGTTCTNTAAPFPNTLAATASPQTVCSGTADDDVWYSFVAATANDVVTVQSGAGYNAQIEVFSSSTNACGGTLTSIGCINNTSTAGAEVFTGSTLVPGNTYFVRVYHTAASTGSGQFDICVTAAVPACVSAGITPANASLNVTYTGTTLSWTGVAGATGYDVYFDAGATATTLVAGNQAGTTFATGALLQNQLYTWTVIAKNAVGDAVGCASYTFNTDFACSTPTPGATLSSAGTGVCPTTSITLSFANLNNGNAVTYQWQADAGAGFADIVGATNATYTTTQSANTSYQCNVTCPTGPTTVASTPIAITMNAAYLCYCSSIPTQAADEEIFGVSMTSTTGSMSQTSDCLTLAPGSGSIVQRYGNYTANTPMNIVEGTTVNFTIDLNACGIGTYDNGTAIFIDLNQNGSFADAGEQVFAEASVVPTAPGTGRVLSGSFSVPFGPNLGITGMRIMNVEGSAGAGITPCMTYGYGETEDYLVDISASAACTALPVPGAAVAATSTFCGSGSTTITLTNTTTGGGVTYQWYDDQANQIVGATNATYVTPTLTATTGYYCEVTCPTFGTGTSGTATVTINPVPTVTAGSNGTVCVGSDVNLTATSAIATGYSWSGPNSFSSAVQNPSILAATAAAAGIYTVTASAAGCTATATTSVSMTTSTPPAATASATPATICAGDPSTLDVTLATPPPPSYCTASATNTVCANIDEFIENVNFGSINNTTTCAGTSYSDFTAQSTTVTAGSTGLAGSILCSNFYSGDQYRLYFDWNQDGDFADAGEEFNYTNTPSATTAATFSVDVPAGALNGSTRMRARLTYTSGMAPCGNSSYGETEDYTINVTGGASATYSYAWTDPTSATTSSVVVTPSATTTYTVTVGNGTGCVSTSTTTVTVNNCATTLNLNVWLEGYFDGTSAMAEVMLNQNYLPTPPSGDVDDITVELREFNITTSEYDVIPNGSAVARLHTDGTASAVFSPAPANGNYYVVITHRNHVQVYSHDPVTIASGTNSYSFASAAIQAAGSNMALLANGEYGMFSGDINQDGYVDGFDYGDFDTDSQNNVSGTYVATDLNGDGYVDSFDYGLMDTNTQNNVTVQFP